MTIRFANRFLGLRLYEWVLLLLLATFMGSLSLSIVGDNIYTSANPFNPVVRRMRLVLIAATLPLLLGLALLQPLKLKTFALPLLLLWTLFATTSLIAGVANADMPLVADALWFLLVMPFVFYVCLPNLLREQAASFLALALILGHAPFIIASLILNPIQSSWLYRGVFVQSNGFAQMVASFSLGVCILLSVALHQRRPIWQLLALLGVIIGTLVLILLSASRTYAVLMVLLLLIIFADQCSITRHQLRVARRILGVVSVLALGIGIFAIVRSEDVQFIWNGISQKTITRLDNPLSNRQEYWSMILSDARFFGNGSSYLDIIRNSHSDVLRVLAESGIPAAVFFFLFHIAALWYAYVYRQRNWANPYRLVPLLIILYYVLVTSINNLFGAFGMGSTIAFYLTIGMLLTAYDQQPLGRRPTRESVLEV